MPAPITKQVPLEIRSKILSLPSKQIFKPYVPYRGDLLCKLSLESVSATRPIEKVAGISNTSCRRAVMRKKQRRTADAGMQQEANDGREMKDY